MCVRDRNTELASQHSAVRVVFDNARGYEVEHLVVTRVTLARSEEVAATLRVEASGAVAVTFDAPVFAVTPGQAAVFYDGDRVLGGGFLD
jgi:tRNA U34 2-thiouridine synthase MnmA/TrmU